MHEQAGNIDETPGSDVKMEWKPIYTAPRNEIILLRLMNGEVFSGWKSPDGMTFAEGSDIGFLNAWHWMPLPSPPGE